eukprot:scaffold21_cov107-Cylindrotheca_fusiformis.AAC.15
MKLSNYHQLSLLSRRSVCRSVALILALGILRFALLQRGLTTIPTPAESENKRNVEQSSRREAFNYKKPSSINYTELVQVLSLPRVFSLRFMNATSLFPPWCTHDPNHVKSLDVRNDPWPYYQTGLLYNKMPKAASSTTSGIVLRISHNVAARFSAQHRCTSYERHLQKPGLVKKAFGGRDKNRSFLISSVRNPASQAISHFFFITSRGRKSQTNERIMQYLRTAGHQMGALSDGQGGFQMEYLTHDAIPRGSAWRKETPNRVRNPDAIHRNLEKILQDYDFIILAERYDESIVVLQLLLGLEATDVLYLSSKKSGDSYHPNPKFDSCALLKKAVVPETIARHLESDEWFASEYGDYVLIEAVRQSLDLTIQAIGEEKFQQALETFLKLKNQATDECINTTNPPCSDKGVLQLELAKESCYEKDWGCGYKCLDNMIA